MLLIALRRFVSAVEPAVEECRGGHRVREATVSNRVNNHTFFPQHRPASHVSPPHDCLAYGSGDCLCTNVSFIFASDARIVCIETDERSSTESSKLYCPFVPSACSVDLSAVS